MKGYTHIKYLVVQVLFLSALSVNESKAQNCTPDIFFNHYQGNAAVYTNKVITTPQDEIIAAGSTLKLNGDFLDATDGWVTKLSPRGIVLWSKRYYIAGFNSGGFLSIENATDNSYLVTARFGKFIKNYTGTWEEWDAATFILHIDKFGNLIWMKRISEYIRDSYLSSITRLNDNSFLLSGNIINSAGAKLLVLKTDLSGHVSWNKLMYADSTQMFRPSVKQLKNGELLLTGMTMKIGPNYSYFSEQGYYFLKLDPSTGDVIRSTGIYIQRDRTNRQTGYDHIREITELSPDTLLLASSFSELQLFGTLPGQKEGILIKTGLNGEFYKADAYYNTQPGCLLLDVKYSNGKINLLLDDGYRTLYAEINRAGEIINQKAYENVFSLLQGYKFLDQKPDNRVFFTGRGQFALMGLMKTENDGSIQCMESAPQVITKPVSSFFSTGSIQLSYINTNRFAFEDFSVGAIGWFPYTFNPTTDCIATCCDHIRSDTSNIELCNASSYRLPDNSVVKETGLYYVNTKNANTCDSISYYNIKFSTKPVINLGKDTCLKNNTTIVLKADAGFANYNWMGINTTSHLFTVTAPGKYNVSITNQCGTGMDEIEVYDNCEFPVYMPTAFTPDNDGLNDFFSFPLQNKNRFISLDIYNRAGQRVFFTTDRTKGWNGKNNSVEQSSGVYVYLLRVETLDGKNILNKGALVLIRR